ncbi:hypothetical protein BN1723_015553 [Verticillium longisporum]|uniref:Uncharacterized protein n=1 Tax=Verticillium longisporum TaxID=100787 RepID=A0A0G4MZM4_VERLO|nr:hypothetical protein BN1723_015553 [Verticillium longisporum]
MIYLIAVPAASHLHAWCLCPNIQRFNGHWILEMLQRTYSNDLSGGRQRTRTLHRQATVRRCMKASACISKTNNIRHAWQHRNRRGRYAPAMPARAAAGAGSRCSSFALSKADVPVWACQILPVRHGRVWTRSSWITKATGATIARVVTWHGMARYGKE